MAALARVLDEAKGPYRGPDRRSTRALHDPQVSRRLELIVAAAVLISAVAVAWPLAIPGAAAGALAAGVVAATVATVGAALVVRHRLSTERAGVRAAASATVALAAAALTTMSSNPRLHFGVCSAVLVCCATQAPPARTLVTWRNGAVCAAALSAIGVLVASGSTLASVFVGAAAVWFAYRKESALRHGHPVLVHAAACVLVAAAVAVLIASLPASTGGALAPLLLVLSASAVAVTAGGLDAAGAIVQSQRRLYDALLRVADHEQSLEHERTSNATQRHDQRSALIAIEGALGVLATGQEALAPTDREHLTSAVRAELARLRRGVERGAKAKPPAAKLKDLLAPMVTCWRAEGANVRLSVPGAIELAVDGDTVLEIVQNLIDNAVDHGGNQKIRVSAGIDADALWIAVSDQGPGVPEALREVIFDRGVSSKTATHSGLGLFAARSLACSLGGTLHVEDARGGGAQFVLRVPR